MKLQPPKGTRDLLPPEMNKRNELYQKIRGLFESRGYGEVETPAFEYFDLLSKKSGPEIEEEIYSFEDKGGRKLGLRFDPTVPIARIVASDPSKPKPIKYYYITRMWRYENPQQGRWREFWQSGCELIGPNTIESDIEILKLAYDIIRQTTEEKFTIKINSREAIDQLANKVKVPKNEKKEIYRALDKLDKKTEEEAIEELKEKNINPKNFKTMLNRIKAQEMPEGSLKRLKKLKKELEKEGVTNIEIDPLIVRGLDYYTGMVFETFIEGKESTGSVCSGGRYDSLIGIYGKEKVPAVGFGLGIDRLLELTDQDEEYNPVEFYICPVKDEVREKARSISTELREEGLKTDIDLMNRDLSKQFKYINSKNIPYALIVGPRELKNNEITLKDMETGEEDKISLGNLKEKLKKLVR